MKEAAFIAALKGLATTPGARGLDDDAAVMEVGGETLVLTHDAMAEGTHFSADADLADVAWKLVATNLSDLAAKGAEPDGVLLGYTLGPGDERFLLGLGEALTAFDVSLLGGDTIGAKSGRTFGLTAIGWATHTPVPSRSGAKVGDAVWLCGKLGAAMLGFEQPSGLYGEAFLRPRPLLQEGQALASRVTAMMDVSDGLLLDATRMATASGVTLDLRSTHMEVADRSRLLDCLSWGDDYALLFTCDPKIGVPVTAAPIGTVVAASAHPIMLDGAPPPPAQRLGYLHG
jgi:thiamine-monophosphate kinase